MFSSLASIADPRSLPLGALPARAESAAALLARLLAWFGGAGLRALVWLALTPLLWSVLGAVPLAVVTLHGALSLVFAQWPRLVAAEWTTRLRADQHVGDQPAQRQTVTRGLYAVGAVLAVQGGLWWLLTTVALPALPLDPALLQLLVAFCAADAARLALLALLQPTLTLLTAAGDELRSRALAGLVQLADVAVLIGVLTGQLVWKDWPRYSALALGCALLLGALRLVHVRWLPLPDPLVLPGKRVLQLLAPGPMPPSERPPQLAGLWAFAVLASVVAPVSWLAWYGLALRGLDLALHACLYLADQLAPLGIAPGIASTGYDARRRYRRSMDAILIVCAGMAIAVGVFGRPVLHFLLGERRLIPAPAMVAFGVALITAAPGVVAAWQLQLHGRGRRVLAAAAGDALAVLVLGTATVQVAGLSGALLVAALLPLLGSSLALPLAACRELGIRFGAFWFGRLWRTALLVVPASVTLALLQWGKPARTPRDLAVHAAIALILYAIPAFAGWHLLDARTERDLRKDLQP